MLRLLGILITVLCAIAAAVLTFPGFFRVERLFPIAQIVSFRGILALALRDRKLPPTINLDHPGDGCDLDFVPRVARDAPGLEVALSNSFGFGGTNGALVMRRWGG